MALLQNSHGFSRAHANAIAMHARGSTSAQRVASLNDYLAEADPTAAATLREILATAQAARPDLDCLIAWNHPQLKGADGYVFGVSLAARHLLLAPWDAAVLAAVRPRLESAGYTVNRKTIRVPLDWTVDAALIAELVGATPATSAQ